MTGASHPETNSSHETGGHVGRVDVIIPRYNYSCFLYHCVNSVLNQAGVDVRVLVIDDASDNTAEIAAALARENPKCPARVCL
jgi:glycosyltransferase involved in cell wall biosynthesis